MSLPESVHIYENNDLLSEHFSLFIENLMLKLLNKKGKISIGLSGGSLIDLLSLIFPKLNINWSRVQFFFVDERFVSFDSNESTFGLYKKKLFSQLSVNEENLIHIDPKLSSIEQINEDYRNKLKKILFDHQLDSSFDIVLLGMGPDGHTASLFPNHPILKNDDELVTFIKDSPKPPSERVTLTMNTINKTKHKIVIATGESKSTIIKEVLLDKNEIYPIGQIQNLIWFIDQSAASKLSFQQ